MPRQHGALERTLGFRERSSLARAEASDASVVPAGASLHRRAGAAARWLRAARRALPSSRSIMRTFSAALQRALYEADKRWGRGYRRARDLVGWSRPPRIVPYRGWGSNDRATLLARVLEDRGAPEWREGAPLWHTFAA